MSARNVSLPGIEEFSKMLRTMFINIGFFAATLLLIPSVAGQFTRTAIVIDPIAVPEAMATQGLTSEVVANRIWDGLQEFAATASANRETIAAIPDSQLIEFSLPDAGVSIDSIFAQIRQFFQIYETRIGGEYICATPDCAPEGVQLRLRVVQKNSNIIDLPPMGAMSEREYYREAAAGIYEIIDPYVAIAAQAESAPLKAATLARGLILDGSKDAKWAHNLVGDIELRGGDAVEAAAEYQAALALDPDFHVARAGLAHAQLVSGDPGAAEATLAELEKRAPGSTLVPVGRSEIAVIADRTDDAVAQLRKAGELEPLEPKHLYVAGNVLLAAARTDEAITAWQEALAIDPGYEPALNVLAQTLWQNGRTEEAEQVYRQWLDFDPDNAEARGSLGVILAGLGRHTEALQQLDLAYAAGQTSGMVPMSRGTTLVKLGRFGEAAEVFEALLTAEPANYAYAAVLAHCYEQLGRREAATQVFRDYLAAAPADDENRSRAEARLSELSASPRSPAPAASSSPG